jgi:hypothetical protein
MRSVAAREFVEPAQALLTDPLFWKKQSQGLCLFLTGDTLQTWRLPTKFTNFLWIGNRFYLKPLLPSAESDGRYFVIAVSQNQAKLYAGNHDGVAEVHIDTLPKNLTEALHYHQPEGLFQVRSFHTTGVHGAARGKSAKEGAVFHGQGGGAEHEKNDIVAYFRIIDRALSEFLREERAPWCLPASNFYSRFFSKSTRMRILPSSPSTATQPCGVRSNYTVSRCRSSSRIGTRSALATKCKLPS